MQNLNHQVWGKIRRFNQKAAIVAIIVICMGLFSVLTASLAREFSVFYNQKCHVVLSYTQNPHSLMKKAGIQPTARLEYELDETNQGPVLRVGPKCMVTVMVDGQTLQVKSRTDRVQNILDELGVTLGDYDIVTPAVDTIFKEDCTITVDRVVYQTAFQVEATKPVVVYEETALLPMGEEQVKTFGTSGERLVTYSQKTVNGNVTQQREVSALMMKDSQPQVVLRGTGDPENFVKGITNNAVVNKQILSPLELEKPLAVNEKGQPLTYKKCIKGLATAYTANEGGSLTATGERVQVGYVAVDPKEIPYGTMLFIKTTDGRYVYGIAKACDTGGFIDGPVTVDLYFEKTAECIQFGVRDVEIYVL